MGYWKAEEFRKFCFPASECVFGGILPENLYSAWIMVCRITEIVYCSGRNAITSDTLRLLQKLIWRHNILTEENEGEKMCVISLHNLVHLPDDIRRFSSPDNFWCYTFERAVHTYVERSSNKKNLEKTFASAECRRELLKSLKKNSTSVCEHGQYHNGCMHHVCINTVTLASCTSISDYIAIYSYCNYLVATLHIQ